MKGGIPGPRGIDLPSRPLEASLEVIRRFDEVFRRTCGREGMPRAEGIVRRLQEFPQLILYSSLVQAISFLLSKIDDQGKRNAYIESLRAVSGMEGQRPNAICRDAGGEGGGYPQALALILAYAGMQAGCGAEELLGLDSRLVRCMERISSKGVILDQLVVAYATELKKLASALYISDK